MDFFRSVFSEEPQPTDSREPQNSPEFQSRKDPNPNPNPNPSSDPNHSPPPAAGAWSFGGLVKTLASRSESVLQTYSRDLEEFRSGLQKETAVIRDAARRAVKDLPGSLEAGASVATDSLESVGQAIDDLGSTVWRGTAEIISQGKDTLLASEHDSDYPSDNSSQHIGAGQFSNQSLGSVRYSRFDAQKRTIQCDLGTYSEVPDDSGEFNQWRLGFKLDQKGEEIESLFEENHVMELIYKKLVPSAVDHETFWSRYFYRLHKLKLAEDARANLVKRAISGGDEEELTWDVDDDDGNDDNNARSSSVSELQSDPTSYADFDKNNVGIGGGESSQIKSSEKNPKTDGDGRAVVAESVSGGRFEEKDESETNSDKSVVKGDERLSAEGKGENVESCKDSDISVVSTQPSLPEEVDLGWDEIEDIGSNDENKGATGGSPNRIDLCKRLSTAEEEEYLSWDIEDDDEPVKS